MSELLIADYIRSEAINIDLRGDTKQAVIEELLGLAFEHSKLDLSFKGDLLKKILIREQKSSTGLQGGLAIPHAKTDLIDELVVVIGLHKKGVAFGSPDNHPSTIFILTLSPIQQTHKHLELLSFLCGKLNDNAFREKVLKAEDGPSLHRLLTC